MTDKDEYTSWYHLISPNALASGLNGCGRSLRA